tara:strand:- start:1726 stop:2100 length:375 start_codon:yes stop_codon:yes gene_type:complete
MALTDAEYTAIHNKTGSDKTALKNIHDEGHALHFADNPEESPIMTTLIYQIQQMQDELDYLRTEISTNKDKVIPNVTGTTNHAISFGALTATTVKGKTTYSVVMTVTDSSGAKAVLKTITLTLA